MKKVKMLSSLIIGVLGVTACTVTNTPTPVVSPTVSPGATPVPTTAPTAEPGQTTSVFPNMVITTPQQLNSDNRITVQSLFLDKPGYLVVYTTGGNAAQNEVIGTSGYLDAGFHNNVGITVDPAKAASRVQVIVHYEQNGNQQFNAADDQAARIAEKVVTLPININTAPGNTADTGFLPNLVVSEQMLTANDEITVRSLFLDQPGFVVIHANSAENTPGEVIGNSGYLATGVHNNVRISVDPAKAGNIVYAMLHYDDNNNQQYNFPAADQPVKVGEQVIFLRINLNR